MLVCTTLIGGSDSWLRLGYREVTRRHRDEGENITSQQLRFLAVGGFNTVFNWAVFSVLVWCFGPTFYLWSLGIMYALGSVVGFALYRRFVFPVKGNVGQDAARFQLVNLGPFIVNIFFLVTLIGWLGVNPVVGQTVFVVLNATWSYLGHKYFSFRR